MGRGAALATNAKGTNIKTKQKLTGLVFVRFVFVVRLRRRIDAPPAELTYAARREECSLCVTLRLCASALRQKKAVKRAIS